MPIQTDQKELQSIIAELKQLAFNDWKGSAGEQDAKKMGEFLNKKLENYSKVLGYSKLEIMKAIEAKRDYNVRNYYQEANFPELVGNIDIYETIDNFLKRFPSKKFICPACSGISTDPNECNSGKEISKGKICDWKSYGLFGCAGKGYKFIIKKGFLENAHVWEIFKPVELK